MIRLLVIGVLAYAAYIAYQAERRPAATPAPPKRRKQRPAAKRTRDGGGHRQQGHRDTHTPVLAAEQMRPSFVGQSDEHSRHWYDRYR
jgi:uncharacterized membrane protein YebE (DUF533 family)